MRNRTFCTLLFLSIALFTGDAQSYSKARYVPAPAASPVAAPSPLPSAPVRIFFNPTQGVLESQKPLLRAAQQKLADVQASPCFAALLNARPVVQIAPLTVAEFTGKAVMTAGSFGVNVYHLPWYRSLSSEVGKEGSGGVIQIRDVALTSPCNVASLYAHEAIGHNALKLSHDFNNTARRPYSGPYSLNAAVDACCR